MALRWNRNRPSRKSGTPGSPQLTLAHIIVTVEKIARIFARPLMVAGVFVALSWLGVFGELYPWMHLVVLILFTLFFFEALGAARAHWRPVSPSEAKRRVEEATGLRHRPLDVLEDRPVALSDEQMPLWQAHVERAKAQVKSLRWPAWKLSFAERDPYALRYALLIVLGVGVISSWGVWGGRLIAAVNPALGKELSLFNPALDAWITPPEYTGLAPIMIATPAGGRHDSDVITVPEGSIISAHLAEKDGDVPDLTVNGQKIAFSSDEHGDYEAVQEIRSGDTVAVHRGWQKLGSWHVHVVADQAPQIAFTDAPSATERKSVRMAFQATDDYGVVTVAAHITPRESLPGASMDPVDVELASPNAKDVKRVSYEDLTAHPWAGLPVQIQLIAVDAAGHKAMSEAVDFTLPERTFFHPVARALIEERKKLLQSPDDESVRNEAANIMAGVAHEPADYRGDPVVLMALRAGAVRLILDHSHTATASVDDMIWQSAIRIEDGSVGMAEQNLRQAQKDLQDALDRNAPERDIQQRIDRLRQALAQYMAELSMRMASKPGPVQDLSPLMGDQTNTLTPKDLDRMLENMRNLSASGARDAAREELAKLQQLMEGLRTDQPQLTQQQQQALQKLKGLQDIVRDQQKLLDKTFQSSGAHDAKAAPQLGAEQNSLLDRLNKISSAADGMKKDDRQKMALGQAAMKFAEMMLRPDGQTVKNLDMQGAVTAQNQAIKALQQLEQSMREDLRSSLMLLPRPGSAFGQGSDPFGRQYGGMMQDENGVKVPDQMETRKVREILDELQRRAGDASRPKTERDYIERLLQNF